MSERELRGANYAAELQPKEVYKQRRQRLAEMVGEGTLVLWGADDSRSDGDVGTFRQSSDFFYLTGVELPNAVLVLRPKEETEALFLPPRDPAVERWTGPKWGPGQETADALGFDEVFSVQPSEVTLASRRRPVPGFEGRLHEWLSEDGAQLATQLPALSVDTDLSPVHEFVSKLRQRLPTFAVRDLSEELHRLRMVKDDGEMSLIDCAVDATVAAHRAVAAEVGVGVREGALDGLVYSVFRAHGAEGIAFPSIVGSGYNATTLHYDQNVCVLAPGELVVIDIGARYGYYCGDVTRTYPVDGVFTDRQREVYDVVLAAHDRVAEAIKPGVTISDLREIAYETMASSPARDSKGEHLGNHFIHGLGHFLGMDAHDPGSDVVALQPGMVITNEPGVYLQDEGLGVRIENDFVITQNGCRNLSQALPTGPAEIEALMRSSVTGGAGEE